MVQLAPVPAWGRVGIGQDLARGKPGQVQHARAQGKCASRRRGPLRHPAPANGTATVKRTAPIAFGSCKPSTSGTAYASVSDNVPLGHVDHEDEAFIAFLRGLHG